MTATQTVNSLPPSEEIEKKIDRPLAGAIPVSPSLGGLGITSMADLMEVAKLMAIGRQAIPGHLRDNVGACLAVCIQAVEWRMSPFAVANKSYVVNDRLGFESQLVHAVIESRAPLVGRLRHSFSGEGAKRRCKVWAFAKGEPEAFEYESPEFGGILPKNSPLWKTKPDLQLYYNTSRDWARVYFPDVILGVFTEDELSDGPAISTAAPLPVGRMDLRPLRPTFEERNVNPAHPETVLPDRDPTAPGPDMPGETDETLTEADLKRINEQEAAQHAGGGMFNENGPYGDKA